MPDSAQGQARIQVSLNHIPTYADYAEQAEKKRISTQSNLSREVETIIESRFGGYQSLFLQSDLKSSPSEWASLIYDYIQDPGTPYTLVGLGSEHILESVHQIKDQYREEQLLMHANNWVYSQERYPATAQELRQLLQDRQVLIEEKDLSVLEAIARSEGKFARTKVAIEPGCLELRDRDNIVVIMDSHQNKHHHPQLPELNQYSGARGSQFVNKDLEWHRQVTVPTVTDIMTQAINSGGVDHSSNVHCPSKRPINGIIYDLSISYDKHTGKYVGIYHCNPLQTEI